ncbi:hypothetical protein NLI96_g8218 [Meripilus lineatus]|uniref:Uncharacterized protein n=1 Tax=Meripilus lineatus TaxID=2056292 RepID=A0AAD5UZX3_9APHY|nr:hypothetical protein NLI96_g8218 [Physisporinus lineatus]
MSTRSKQGQPQSERTRGGRNSNSRGNPRANTRPAQESPNAQGGADPSDGDFIERLSSLRVVDPDEGEDRNVGRGPTGGGVHIKVAPIIAPPPAVPCQLPPLRPPTGPPIKTGGFIGGAFVVPTDQDPRTFAVSMGFPVSIHPLRIPNTRAQHSSGSSHSVIDYKFVRLAGLIHTMVPLRRGIDDVNLVGLSGGNIDVKGYVDIIFDALGYEFEQRCWVMDLGFPLELQLGGDWATKYQLAYTIRDGAFTILEADAKRVRPLDDIYVTR